MAWKIVLFQVILTSSFLSYVGSSDEFCYMKPECNEKHWKDQCSAASKTRQSPIALKIPLSDAKKSDRMPKSGLKFNDAYKARQPKYYIIDTGHSLQIQLNTEATSNLKVSGIEGGTYRLAQVHFHWGMKDNVGSEHTINGKRYSAEGHFVHFNTEYASFADALGAGKKGDWKAIAVIGTLYAVNTKGAESTPGFRPVSEGLKKLGTNCGKLIEVETPISLFDLGGVQSTRFVFRYNGSLTTPPCTEAVVWTVFGIPKYIALPELELFRQLKTCQGDTLGNNYRSIQPTPDKTITEVKTLSLEGRLQSRIYSKITHVTSESTM